MTSDTEDDFDLEVLLASLRESEERRAIWQMMPLENHDGGDEDDRGIKERQFLRAARDPQARVYVGHGRAVVIKEPPLRPMLEVEFQATVYRDDKLAGAQDLGCMIPMPSILGAISVD